MKVEIITIGDEILIGQITDTNSAFIGKELTKIGADVIQITSIHDDFNAIFEAFQKASKRADVVLVTGGLGPTKDDLTKTVLCRYFKDELVLNEKALANVKRIFVGSNRPLLQVNIDQAKVPSKAIVLENNYGTAPGMWLEEEDIVFVALPGVPYEMKALLTEEVLPRLLKKYQRHYIVQKTVLTYGVGESLLADKIADWEEDLPQNMGLAYLPSPGRVRLRLTVMGEKEAPLNVLLEKKLAQLEKIIGEHIGGYEGEFSWEAEIADLLTQSQLTLATSESCTGGKLAARFTSLPGASKYFKGGLIPYETMMKVKILGVSEEIIKKHSVVSPEVAEAMAVQTCKLFGSDFAVSTTGNAGPTKGDSDAEVGTVCIGIAYRNKVESFTYNFGKHREVVVKRAILKSLELLKKKIGQEVNN